MSFVDVIGQGVTPQVVTVVIDGEMDTCRDWAGPISKLPPALSCNYCVKQTRSIWPGFERGTNPGYHSNHRQQLDD